MRLGLGDCCSFPFLCHAFAISHCPSHFEPTATTQYLWANLVCEDTHITHILMHIICVYSTLKFHLYFYNNNTYSNVLFVPKNLGHNNWKWSKEYQLVLFCNMDNSSWLTYSGEKVNWGGFFKYAYLEQNRTPFELADWLVPPRPLPLTPRLAEHLKDVINLYCRILANLVWKTQRWKKCIAFYHTYWIMTCHPSSLWNSEDLHVCLHYSVRLVFIPSPHPTASGIFLF